MDLTLTKKQFSGIEQVLKDARKIDGIYHWKSNGHVVPDWFFTDHDLTVPEGQTEARRAFENKALEDYKPSFLGGPEREELRSIHGAGAKVVNVLTGQVCTI